MIVGATPGYATIRSCCLTEGLYRKYRLKRVFFSAYMPVVESALLPALGHQAARCCGSTGSTRRIGCCAFTAFDAARAAGRGTPQPEPAVWTPSAAGRCNHMELFPGGGQPAPTMKCCCGCPGIGVPRGPADPDRPAGGPPLPFSRPEAAGRGAQAGPVFPHLPGAGHAGWTAGRTGPTAFRAIWPPSGAPDAAPAQLPEQLSLFDPATRHLTGEDVRACLTGLRCPIPMTAAPSKAS